MAEDNNDKPEMKRRNKGIMPGIFIVFGKSKKRLIPLKAYDIFLKPKYRPIWLRNSSINLTNAFDCVIKAFQNSIRTEQARERLKQIKNLILVYTS